MIDGISRSDHGQQNLSGADIARRFIAPDMLFTRLQREPETGASCQVFRNPDQPPGHEPFELVARRKVGRMGTAITEWNTESLRRSDTDICSKLARRNKESQTQKICGDHGERLSLHEAG